MALTEEQKKANKAKNDHEYYLRNKDKIRDYKRIWARKHYQENRQKCIAYQKQYWQNTTADRKRKRKNKMAEYICEFRQENPDAARKYYRNAKHKWTNGVNCTKKEIWQKAEKIAFDFIGNKLKHGTVTKTKFSQFVFDIMSWHNDRLHVFQVTTLRTRAIRRRHLELAEYLRANFMLINIKPTFDELYIQSLSDKLDFNTQKLHTNAIYGKKYIVTDTDVRYFYKCACKK